MNRENRPAPYRVAIIPGDGIGREVIPAAVDILQATSIAFDFIKVDAGWDTFQRTGNALPEITVEILHTCDAALFGAVSSPLHRVPGYQSPIVSIRRHFDLYANMRPIRSHKLPEKGRIDMLIVRENTEGLYARRERVSEDGEYAIAERVISRRASRRVARIALEQARQRRKHLTIVHKANILRESDGLFREMVLAEAQQYPEIRVDEGLVDSVAYRLIREPQKFDVLVAPNLYGDILSDLAAALVGGLGIVPSANLGDNFAVFEPVHGSAPDIAGLGIANPLAAIRAGAMLLDYLGEHIAADAVNTAVDRVLNKGPWTPDLGGKATTRDVTTAVREIVKQTLDHEDHEGKRQLQSR